MLHIENKVALILTGKIIFEQIKARVQTGFTPNVLTKTKIETNIFDFYETIIQKTDAKQQSERNNKNEGLIPILLITGADIPNDKMTPMVYKILLKLISPSIFARKQSINKLFVSNPFHIGLLKQDNVEILLSKIPSQMKRHLKLNPQKSMVPNDYQDAQKIMYQLMTLIIRIPKKMKKLESPTIIPIINIRMQQHQRLSVNKNEVQTIEPAKALKIKSGFLPYQSLNGITKNMLVNIPHRQSDPNNAIYDSELQQKSNFSTQL
ncbi:UNKNOWN [Stylonychia lemnae]|uniref:Uncharacterized protein n=1 Tax=Stylonychia lemnae TaxID=5949 RepID=A0A078AUR8_STYLE|nr:UNKNOWN [Stylonychia lemnae]|eukprot:CDW86145.1 UNKNOWN [Stylonychia lemnae]